MQLLYADLENWLPASMGDSANQPNTDWKYLEKHWLCTELAQTFS